MTRSSIPRTIAALCTGLMLHSLSAPRLLSAEQPEAPPARSHTHTRLLAAEALFRHNQIAEARSLLLEVPEAERDWAWSFLFGRMDRSVRVFRDHRGPVTAVAVSPDGGTVASGSVDSTIILRDAASGAVRKLLRGHTGRVSSVEFSPDGRRLVSGSTDRTVRIWDPVAGTEVLKTTGQFTQGIYQARFSRDGRRIAAGSWELSPGNTLPVIGFVKVLDAETGATLLRILTDDHPAASLAFAPDDSTIVTGTWGFHVKRHSLRDGAVIWDHDLTPLPYYTAVQSVDVSSDGRLVAQCGKDKRIRILDATSGALLQQVDPWHGHGEWVNCVRFSPDGTLLASVSDDGLLKIRSSKTAAESLLFRGHLGDVLQVAWHPDGSRLWSVGADSTLREWRVDTPGERRLPVAVQGLWSAPVVSSGRFLAGASFEQGPVVWDLAAGTRAAMLDTVPTLSAAFLRGGTGAAFGTTEGMIHWYELAGGSRRFTSAGHEGRVNALAYSEPAGLLASAGSRGVRLWDPEDGSEVRNLETGKRAMGVGFLPDGSTLIAGQANGQVKLFDVRTGACTDSFQCGSTIQSMAVSPDGRWLVTGGEPGDCHLWNLAERRSAGTLQGHTKWVYGLAFHPELPILVTGSYDATVRVWDLPGGECRLTLYGFSEAVYTMSLADGGRRVVFTEVSGGTHVIDLPVRVNP
jgi:WD40 repeat protein